MSSLFASASSCAGHLFSLPGLRRTSSFARDNAATQSRKTERFIAANDTVVFEQEFIWDGTEWLPLSSAAHEYDEQQRRTKTTRGNGRVSTKSWMCCGVLAETDEDGIVTSYGYNSAHQLVETIRSEVRDGDILVTPETITTYVRDAAGRVLRTRRDIGAMTTTEDTVYDKLGRVVAQTDALGRLTRTEYSQDGLTTTVTTPAGATFITTRNTDGSLAHESGSGQRELWHAYDIQNYRLRETVKLGDNRTALSQTLINGLGQENTRTMASTTGYFYERSEYNAKGQLIKQYQDTGSRTTPTAPTLYEYDAFGNVVKQTLALGNAPTVHNSPIAETAYTVESTPEGVYQVTTQTRYNAEGEPLSAIRKQLISQSCPHMEKKLLTTNERGLTSTQWTTYNEGTKRTTYIAVPTSDTTTETVAADGFTLRQTDHTGMTQRFSRIFRADGMVLKSTDGRGNATTTQTDLLGRTVCVTDATGAATSTRYDAVHNQPAVITDAMGNTTCYRYDHRGRKTAEWGTAIQPAVFTYDDADRLTSLTTFRASEGDITTDPRNRTDGDTTTWTYHDATGLETRKTYADGSHVDKAYDAYNRLSIETLARGITKTHRYEHARGLLLGTAYSDGSTARSYTYNHLEQMIQVVDDAGTRTIGYNRYGEQETDSLATAEGVTHLITEARDTYGRSTGYTYSKNGEAQQTVTTGYGADGRIAAAGFTHNGEEQRFTYSYLPGSSLLQRLAMPNGVTLTQHYEPQRDLLTEMSYRKDGTLASRSYRYDSLGRPTTRDIRQEGNTRQDRFGYNTRSELTEAQLGLDAYRYSYDNIGNRKAAQGETDATYTANSLNQYTRIADKSGVTHFSPAYDTDGNQTLVKTSTGVWNVEYNAENRPVTFMRTEGNVTTRVTCTYDTMGRRATKKVETNGATTLHERYLYRGYLQIAACDLTAEGTPNLWLITWDPTQPVATRPLAIQKSGTWYCYGWDLTKNICEVFGSNGYINTIYTYTPYGEVTSSGSTIQPIQWSSEYNDAELALVYYNYRHYNPADGRWTGRDMLVLYSDRNAYGYVNNKPCADRDFLGLAAGKNKNSTPDEECWRKRLDLELRIDRLIAKHTGVEPDCSSPKGCTKVSFFIEGGDPCGDFIDSKVGHAAIALGEEFRDFGPTKGNNSPGRSWWGQMINEKNPREVSRTEVLGWLNTDAGRYAVPEVTVMVEFCACEKNAKAMKSYWDNLYDQIERNTPPTWKAPGLHCTSTTCQSLDRKGVRGYMDPMYFLEHILVNLRHECGSQQGGKVYIRKVRSYFY